MSEKIHLQQEIPLTYQGQRLDRALARMFDQYSRACLQNWLQQQHILVDGQVRRARDKVQGGEWVEINAELSTQTPAQAQAIDLTIVHEDDSLIIINKPAGLVVHPAAGNPDNTLLNALLHHHAPLAQLPRGGIVHRLDKDTSGLLVIAKTLDAHHHLVQQLQQRTMGRRYEAIVYGILTSGGTVDAPIGRHPKHRTHMAVVRNGKPAITHYRRLTVFNAHTHLSLKLETGRTHQIRVHMAHIHHPIVGDPVYGGRMRLPKGCSDELKSLLQNFKRQALHAKELELCHPQSQQVMSWTADLPEDMRQLLKRLGEERRFG